MLCSHMLYTKANKNTENNFPILKKKQIANKNQSIFLFTFVRTKTYRQTIKMIVIDRCRLL